MISNPTIETLMNHRSIREYTDKIPSDEVIETIKTFAYAWFFWTQGKFKGMQFYGCSKYPECRNIVNI